MEEREENNERNLGFDFKGFEFVAASEEMGETPIYSKVDNSNSASSPCSEEEAGSSAARTRQQKEPGMDMSEYIERCFANSISRLADMRQGKLPQDNNLFWRAVGYYCDLYGCNDRSIAAKNVSRYVTEFIKQDIN